MIKKIVALSILIVSYAYTQQDILTIVLMVKNEEAVINKTLEPFVEAGINSFLIFDTGSTDATIPTVEAFFKEHNVQHWHIAQEPFIDFATSRNHALDAAEKEFPETTFFLMPDAEWYMQNVKGLIDFCVEYRDASESCYLIRIVNQGIDFTVTRLIRNKSDARFQGVVHEAIPVERWVKVPSDVYFELGMSRVGLEKSKKRWERDLGLLLSEHEKNPDHTRTTFCLAQTYECVGDLQQAYTYYKIRSERQGWLEEDYETFYRLGKVTEALSATDSNYTWHMAFDYYCTAHNILPTRAEPLVRIADHYWPDFAAPLNVSLCYLFAKRACELPYPENAVLFIDPHIYNFKRYELLSKSAWYVGDFENGEIATRNALKKKEMPHLFNNLAAYIGRQAQLNAGA